MRKTATLIACALCLVFAVAVQAQTPVLKMATTTSTNDTGLLDYLAPMFKKATGVELQWVSVGTGKALEHGKNCDVDVLLVHAPEVEKKFVADGFGVDRREVMYNDFVLIGPASDPAKVKGKSTAEALKAIASTKNVFVSRGDKSGTHVAELDLWKQAGLAPDKDPWYVQAGQGMIATIGIAAEKKGYTLTDRGTYIKYEAKEKGKPPLVILGEGDAALRNQYGVITVNTAKCPKANAALAKKFADWITGAAGQKAVADYKMEGKALFFPNAKK